MIVIPAVDVRDGACVQLVGGSYDHERVRLADPVRVAQAWAARGFDTVHVVDLDAATGVGSNVTIVERIIRETDADVNVGGGVRTAKRIEELLDAGAAAVVVGTRALEEPAWIASQAECFPGRIIAAADVKDGRLAVRGWRASIDADAMATMRELSALPLAGILVTAVDVEGSLAGPSLDLVARAVDACTVPVIASGGVGTIDDLRSLAGCGAAAAIIGMALYSGAIDPQSLLNEFAA